MPRFFCPFSCTYDRYVNGDGGCALDLNEPITNTDFKLGVHTCPNSYMPYVSLTCQGPMCGSFMLPCASHFEQTPSIGPDECSYAQTGLVCRAVSGDGDYGGGVKSGSCQWQHGTSVRNPLRKLHSDRAMFSCRSAS